MAPAVRFCTASDGSRIAYTVDGRGPPLVCAAWWVSHLESDWENPTFRAFFGALAEQGAVVRYDRPGVGLSDRDRVRFDFDQQVRDLEAVIDHAGLAQPTLLGLSCGGPPCVRYAAAHPERAARLVLYGSYASGPRIASPDFWRALVGLVRASWDVGSRTLADLFAPDLSNEDAREVCRRQRLAASAEVAADLLDLTYRMDVSDCAGAVRTPSLVLHRRGDGTVPFECGRDLAARIPGAAFLPLEGRAHVPWRGDAATVLSAIQEFLHDRVASAVGAQCAEFRQVGDVWSIEFAARRIHLKDSKGLRDIATLLSNQGCDIAATALMQQSGLVPRERSIPTPAADDRALRSYRRRLADIEEELTDAGDRNDLGRLERLRSEREAIRDEFRSILGLHGRVRPLHDPGDRARKAVSARVRAAVARIAAVHPELGAHLEASISTGFSCRYSPDRPCSWWT